VIKDELGRIWGWEERHRRLVGRLALVVASTAVPVAFRHGQRWTPHFVPVVADAGGLEPPGRLRPGGVYLITGGLGRMGLLLAGHLARVAGATLVLAGRSPLPRPDEFDRLVLGFLDEVEAA